LFPTVFGELKIYIKFQFLGIPMISSDRHC